MWSMNVYDFDNTIYAGESVFDFYIFCVRKHPSLIRFLFIVLISWGKYKLLLLSREKLMALVEKHAMNFIKTMDNVEEFVSEFWDKNQHKIKQFYLETKRDDDVVVSASVGFLLREICGRLGIKNLVCTEVNSRTGKIYQLCFRQNKPDYFKNAFPDCKIKNFYSDSMNDLPMMKLAEKAYLVRGENVFPVAERKLR